MITPIDPVTTATDWDAQHARHPAIHATHVYDWPSHQAVPSHHHIYIFRQHSGEWTMSCVHYLADPHRVVHALNLYPSYLSARDAAERHWRLAHDLRDY